MMRRLLPTATITIAALICTSQAAAATDNTIVSMTQCDQSGGAIVVPAGAEITIHNFGFAQGTYGLIQNFLRAERTTLTLSDDTNTVHDLSGQWGAPQQLDKHLWITRLPDTDTGIALTEGQSITATFDITFTRPLLVAFPPVTSSGDNGPFLVGEDGPLSCVITGTTP